MSGFGYAHAVLRAVAAAGESGFAEISRACGEPVAATLSRTLKGLIAEGLLLRTEAGRYRPGPAAVELASLLVGGPQARIEEACRRLAAATGQSALCCGLVGDGMQRLAASEVPGGMSYGPLRQPMRLLAMGFGIPLLDVLSAAEQERIVAEHLAASGDPASELEACRHQVQTQGVLVRGERLANQALGCTRICARSGTLVYGITVFGRPEHHADTTAWCAAVRELVASLPSQPPV
jgi:DNA-binding IclR family transcriptional regulator